MAEPAPLAIIRTPCERRAVLLQARDAHGNAVRRGGADIKPINQINFNAWVTPELKGITIKMDDKELEKANPKRGKPAAARLATTSRAARRRIRTHGYMRDPGRHELELALRLLREQVAQTRVKPRLRPQVDGGSSQKCQSDADEHRYDGLVYKQACFPTSRAC